MRVMFEEFLPKGSFHNSCYMMRSGAPYPGRKKTEEKAKVVASVWGEEFIQFLATLGSCFASDDFE